MKSVNLKVKRVILLMLSLLALLWSLNVMAEPFNGRWYSTQYCEGVADANYQHFWTVSLSQNADQVSGSIYFHQCPGAGRVEYVVSGTVADGSSFVTLNGTKNSIAGALGSSAASTQVFTLESYQAPEPQLTQPATLSAIAAPPTPTPTPTPTAEPITAVPQAQLQAVSGQAITATLIDTQTPTTSGSLDDVAALVTLANSATTIERNDGSVIELKENTVALLNPVTQAGTQTSQSITLIRGQVTTSIVCSASSDYIVHTSLAKIVVSSSCASAQRATNNVVFSSNYAQNGLDGTLTVSVVSGSVNITDRAGNVTVVSAGEEKIIQNTIPRSTWVLPINGDKIYGGKTNMLVWTAYAGASSYLLEYNLPAPYFAEENSSAAEFLPTTFQVTDFTPYDDLIIFNIPLDKGLNGTLVEARIYALDAQGNIIANSVSSDKTSVTWSDL